MSSKLNIEPEFFASAKIPKIVASDVVIDNFNVVTSTSIYLTRDGVPWEGSFHQHSRKNPGPNGYVGYMTGIKHTADSVSLDRVEIPNTKIKDFRAVTRVDDRYMSVTQQRIGAGISEGQAIVGQAIDEDVLFTSARMATKNLSVPEFQPSKMSSFFSDLFESLDEQGNGSFCFCFDYLSFLKENCAYPYLWEVSSNTTALLLQKARILSFKILRTVVDTSTRTFNELGTPLHPQKSALNFPGKYTVIALTSQSNGKFSLKGVDSSKAFLNELSVETQNKTNGGLRYFSFTDRSLISARGGTFQYSVLVKALDPTSILLAEAGRKLRRAQRSLKQYLTLAEGFTNGRPNFDIYLDKFIPSFIERYSKPDSTDIWKMPLNNYLEVLETVSRTLKQPAYPGSSVTLGTVLPAALASYVDPSKGTPEGIRAAVQLLDLLLIELETKATGVLAGSATSSSVEGTRKSKLNNKSRARTIETLKIFDHEFVLDGTSGKGYDYITNQTIDYINESIRGRGLRRVSARYFRKRCDIETKRFFELGEYSFNYIKMLKAAAADIDLSQDKTDDSLNANKFSYLTPSFLFSSPGYGTMGAAAKKPTVDVSVPPSEPKSLDDVAATVLENQANPDFKLFPVETKGYSHVKGSSLNDEEQSLKAKYMNILAQHNCTVAAESEEFEKFNEYKVEIDYYSSEAESPLREFSYDVHELASSIETSPFYKTGTPFFPAAIKNINPIPILTTLAQSRIGNSPKNAKKMQKLNFTNSDAGTILDGVNPSHKIATLKKLPNQLKSLVLSSVPGVTVGQPFEQQSPSYMQAYKNLFAIFQMFKNLVEIEYLVGFELSEHLVYRRGQLDRRTGRALLKSPTWRRLTEKQLRLLETDVTKGVVLCRMVKYNNPLLGIGPKYKINLPTIDQHFFLTKDPSSDPILAPEITPKPEGEKVQEIPEEFQTGNQGGDVTMSSHSNDASGSNPELLEAMADSGGVVKLKTFKVFSVFDDAEKEIDAKPFEGAVPLHQPEMGSDGTSGGGY
jgi:hypothetical protein